MHTILSKNRMSFYAICGTEECKLYMYYIHNEPATCDQGYLVGFSKHLTNGQVVRLSATHSANIPCAIAFVAHSMSHWFIRILANSSSKMHTHQRYDNVNIKGVGDTFLHFIQNNIVVFHMQYTKKTLKMHFSDA